MGTVEGNSCINIIHMNVLNFAGNGVAVLQCSVWTMQNICVECSFNSFPNILSERLAK